MDELKTMPESAGIPNPGQHKSLPRLKRFLRWLVIPFLGSAVGAALGCFYFVQLPPLFKATALLQIIAPPKEIPIVNLGSRMESRSRKDELVVVKSSSALRYAVEMGQLAQKRKLAGRSADGIVGTLRNPKSKMLEVRLGSHWFSERTCANR